MYDPGHPQGTVVDGRDLSADVGVQGERIAAIGNDGRACDRRARAAGDLAKAVDPHVHLQMRWQAA